MSNPYVKKAISMAMTKPLSICPAKHRYCRFYYKEGALCLLECKRCEYFTPATKTFMEREEEECER